MECLGQRLVTSPLSEQNRLLASPQKPLPPGASWELPAKFQKLPLGQAGSCIVSGRILAGWELFVSLLLSQALSPSLPNLALGLWPGTPF